MMNKAHINPNFEPRYLQKYRDGSLKKTAEKLWAMMEFCSLCPRMCGTKRLKGEKGFCQSSDKLIIASYHPHHGEEKSLVGRGGSGTVFFSHCSLRCVFCINWEVSHKGEGVEASIEELARMMLDLQDRGCHNINVVTPTHYAAHILLALHRAASQGLRLPFVYNTCGWERMVILKQLDGIVDNYLPDFKYFDPALASNYSSEAFDYPEITKQSLLEMHRQVGIAKPASDGLMYRGLMIRHLVMPNHIENSKNVVQWIAKNLPPETYLNLMSQYTPIYKAFDYPENSRRLTHKEYDAVVKTAVDLGLINLDVQGYPFQGEI